MQMQLSFSESVSFCEWGCNVWQAASWSNMVIMEDCQLGYSPSSVTDAWQAMHARSGIFFHFAITVCWGRSWLGNVPGASFNLNVLASCHSSQDKCRHVSDSRHSLLFCLHFTSNCCLKLHKISNITDQLKSLSEKQYRQLQQANTKNNSRSSRLFTLPWKKSCGRPCMLVIP